MLKTLRFYIKYTFVLLAGYAAFVALIVAGAFITGLDGLFGTYTSMLPSMGVMFVGIFAMTTSGYLDVALSMGARRTHCFWAVELCNLLEAAVMVLLAILARQLLGGLPDPVGVLYDHGPKAWLCIWLVGALTLQTGLLASQIRDPRKQRFARVAMIFCTMILMVGVTVTSILAVLDNALVGGLWPAGLAWLVEHLPLVLAAAALVFGFLAYRQYRKAVVFA